MPLATGPYSLAVFPQLQLYLSRRVDGNMKLDASQPDDPAVTNRRRRLNQLNIAPGQVVSAGLVNGQRVALVTPADAGSTIPQTDGLITDQPDLYLAITVADCLPIVLYDSRRQVIALLHAGWRGLDQGIIKAAIEQMQTAFGVPGNILSAWIGPGIGPGHYEVQADLVNKFAGYEGAIAWHDNRSYLDLKSVARQQLESLGVVPNQIAVSPVCTYDQADTYFSYRHDRRKPVLAMLMLVGRKTKYTGV